MTKKTLCLFDLDGVLLDSETNLSWLETAIKKTLNHFKIKNYDEYVSHLHFNNIKQFNDCCLNLGIDPEIFWPVRNTNYIDEKMKAMMQGTIKPFDDVDDIYQLQHQYQIGIISNSPQEIVDGFVSLFDYTDLFSVNIGRGNTLWDIEHLKPDPYLYDKVRIRTEAEAFIYIGDRESDREFAQKTDMIYYHLQRFSNDSDGYRTLTEIILDLKDNKKKKD
jgi:phosphoglycolate phosphatase